MVSGADSNMLSQDCIPLYSAGPTVEPTMQFSLLSSTDAAQPRFTLSFNVSNGPPTVVNCTVDGNDLAIAQEDVSREVTRALYNGTNQPDMTLVTVTTVGRQPGVYNCTVRVAGVENGSSNMISLGEASSTASISGQCHIAFPWYHC